MYGEETMSVEPEGNVASTTGRDRNRRTRVGLHLSPPFLQLRQGAGVGAAR